MIVASKRQYGYRDGSWNAQLICSERNECSWEAQHLFIQVPPFEKIVESDVRPGRAIEKACRGAEKMPRLPETTAARHCISAPLATPAIMETRI